MQKLSDQQKGSLLAFNGVFLITPDSLLIREVAESVGLKVPASKYREDMSTHMLFGTHERIPQHQKDYIEKA